MPPPGPEVGTPVTERQPIRSGRQSEVALVARGSGLVAGGGFAEFVLRLGIAVILARTLGPSNYGLYNLAISAATLLAGFSLFGMDDAMIRYIAIQVSRKDHSGVRGTIQLGLLTAAILGTLSGVILYVGADWAANRLFDEEGLADLLRLFAVITPVLAFSNVLLGMTRGFNRMGHVALTENIIQSVVRLVLLLALWRSGFSTFVAGVIFGVSDLAAAAAMVYFLQTNLPYERRNPPPARRDTGEIVRFAVPLGVSGVLSGVRDNIQTFVLGILSIAADVGLFSIVARVNLVSRVTYRAIVSAVKPLFAGAHAAGDQARVLALYSSTTRWTLTLNLPFFLVTVLYSETLLSIFGDPFAAGALALIFLAGGEFVVAATGTCGSLIDMAGHTRIKLFNSILWIVMQIGLSILLVPRWGVVGAAASSSFSVGFMNLLRVIEVRILDKVQPYHGPFWKPILAAAAAGSVGFGLIRLSGPRPGFGWVALQAATVFLIYAGLVLAFKLHPEDREILDRVISKLRRRKAVSVA